MCISLFLMGVNLLHITLKCLAISVLYQHVEKRIHAMAIYIILPHFAPDACKSRKVTFALAYILEYWLYTIQAKVNTHITHCPLSGLHPTWPAFECNYVCANPRRRRLPRPNQISNTGQSSKHWNMHYGPTKFIRKCAFPPRCLDVHCKMPVVRTCVYAFNCNYQSWRVNTYQLV